MKSLSAVLVFLFLLHNSAVFALEGKHFDRMITVIFENKDYSVAMKQPFFRYLADQGANFSNFMALARPSQPNYIGLTSGSVDGVTSNENVDLNVKNVVDLLESKRITWKVYAEDYPGNCFKGARSGAYVRKHNPFISYLNVQQNPVRCAHIVNAVQFAQDAANGMLSKYVVYIPDVNNDGHDTSIDFADKWYEKEFSPYVHNQNFMRDTILVSTFDESHGSINQIYTAINGPSVRAGVYPDRLNTYSLLALVQENWRLRRLDKKDEDAPRIPNIWR